MRRRVNFITPGESDQNGSSEAPVRCDRRGHGRRKRKQQQTSDQQPQHEDVACEQPPPAANLRFRTAEGDVFEVEASLVWHQSQLVRHLVEDAGPSEEIPLPSVKTGTLALLIDQYKNTDVSKPLARGNLKHETRSLVGLKRAALLELHWAAKLLMMERIQARVLATLAQQLETDADCSDPFGGITMDVMLLLLRDGQTYFSPDMLCKLVVATSDDVPPGWGPSVASAISPLLKHSSEEVSAEARRSLLELATLDALRPLLECGDYGARMDAASALPHNCPDAWEVVLQLLGHKSWQVRSNAIYALAQVAPHGDHGAIEKLGKMLEDPVREVRDAVVRALHTFANPDDADTIATIASSLKHSDWPVQSSALRALAAVAPCSPDVIEAATEQLKNSNATFMKFTAIKVLRESVPEEPKHQHVQEDPGHGLLQAQAAMTPRARWGDSDEEWLPGWP